MPTRVRLIFIERFEEKEKRTIAQTAVALSTVAFGAYVAERTGVMGDWSPVSREAGESMAHPVLGYAGAYLGVYVADRLARIGVADIPRRAAILAGAFVVNLGAESAQALLSPGTRYTNFLAEQNIPETTKDLVFAGLGAALLYWQARRALEREPSEVELFDWWEEVPELRPPFDWQTHSPELDYQFDE